MNIRTTKAFAMIAIFATPFFAGGAYADDHDGRYVTITEEENLEGTPTDAHIPILIYARKPTKGATDLADAENLEGTPTDTQTPITVYAGTTRHQQNAADLTEAWNLEGTPTRAETPILVFARNKGDTDVAKVQAAATTQVSLKQ